MVAYLFKYCPMVFNGNCFIIIIYIFFLQIFSFHISLCIPFTVYILICTRGQDWCDWDCEVVYNIHKASYQKQDTQCKLRPTTKWKNIDIVVGSRVPFCKRQTTIKLVWLWHFQLIHLKTFLLQCLWWLFIHHAVAMPHIASARRVVF